jgi:class 3 adenylate cyclase
MATEGYKRELTTILSADVAGYSRLMGDDEAATLKTLTTYRGIMADLIKQHRGRVVDSPGDNVLAEFTSVVDGVQCAVALQKELQARNAELSEDRRMEFRIGINLGDVIEEEDRIYGDGVNIAARLEALADPKGICISKTAFDHIETKLPLRYEYLGEQSVKNIPKPVGAYRVLMEPRVTVVSVIEVEGEDEAVAVANDTGYGLSAAVVTRDFAKGLTLAERIESGMVHMNDQTVSDEPQVAFGGRAGLEEFTELRWISMQLSPRHYPF